MSASSGSPDLRLFGAALGTWGATLGALHSSAAVAVEIGAVAASAATALAVGLAVGRRQTGGAPTAALRSRRRAGWWTVIAVLLGVVCGTAATASRTAVRDAQPLAGLARAGATVNADLVVTDDPRPVRSGQPGPATAVVRARLVALSAGASWVHVEARVVVFATDATWLALLPSQRVSTRGHLSTPRGGDLTAATLSVTGKPERIGRPAWVQVAAARLRAGLQAACLPLPAQPGGLLPGLVIGDTSRLDPALEDEFRATGLTHLVAVSGANLAIVLGVVLFLARRCRAGPWLASAVCAAALAGFVILARPSPSVVRAAAMGVIGLMALATGRPRAAPPALAAAVIVGLLIDPALAGDPGFALSTLATGGLVLLAPRLRDALRAHGVPPGAAEAIAVPAAAHVACGPVIVGLSGVVSVVAIPANLLAVPAVAPATLLGVAAALGSPVWPAGAQFLAFLASWPARWLVAIAHVGSAVPAGTLPWPAGLTGGVLCAAATVALLVVSRWPAVRVLLVVAVTGAVAGAAPVRLVAPGWPPDHAVVVACDVGQGDAVVLPTVPGEAVVVDAGPDPHSVDACLRRLGIGQVPLLVITHFHADHVGGMAGVEHGRRIGEILVPPYKQPALGAQAVSGAARAVHAPVVDATPGWTYNRGGLAMVVLGPSRTLVGTRSDPNNNSLVIRAVNSGVSILLAGDAETEEQHVLLGQVDRALLRADVLKVAHHGSAYQDPDLLDAVDPAVALVSVGAHNLYGHPNASLLARLSRQGVSVLRTDRNGDLAVVDMSGVPGVAVRGAAAAPQPASPARLGRAVGASATGMGLWRHDLAVLGRALPGDRRRGAARGPWRGRRGRCGRRDGRPTAGRVRRRRYDGRGPPRGREPLAVRRSPSCAHPRRPRR